MSMSTNYEGRYRAAVRTDESKEVKINDFEGVVFTQRPCIGTDQLGSGFALIILSPRAALLAHVAPRPEDSLFDPTGIFHMGHIMDRLFDYQWRYERYFPHNFNAWVICTVFLGSVILPHQQQVMFEKLRDRGFNVDAFQIYHVPFPSASLDGGSVFVDARGSTVKVFVEDHVVFEAEKIVPQGLESLPVGTEWDGTDWRSAASPGYVWINNEWVYKPLDAAHDGMNWPLATRPGYM